MYFLKNFKYQLFLLLQLMIITVFAFFKNFRSEPKENIQILRTMRIFGCDSKIIDTALSYANNVGNSLDCSEMKAGGASVAPAENKI